MDMEPGTQAVPTATDVIIIGEAIVGGALVGSYTYVNDPADPEGASSFMWTVNGLVVSREREFRVLDQYAGSNVIFAVTPVSISGGMGATALSPPKRIENGFQNISDEENDCSFMKQHGNFSFHSPEPPDRIFVSTGGAFSLVDPPSSDVFVQGQAGYGATVPDAIKLYLQNNPAAVLFATEYDFGTLVPLGTSSNQLLVWGADIPVGHDLTRLRDIRAVYANSRAFAYIHNRMTAQSRWIDALGLAASGGTVPDTIHLKLVNDPPLAIYATLDAFAVLTTAGRVHAWGNAANGGTIDAVTQGYLDQMRVTRIISNNYAFCALDDDGGLVAWGNQANGGNIPGDRLAAIYNDGCAKSVIASQAAFCAITKGRAQAISWGNAAYGGTMTPAAAQLSARGGIVLCKSATWAYCMANADGHSAAWGVAGQGGTIPTLADGSPGAVEGAEALDMSTLMSGSDVSARIEAIFREKMRREGVDVNDASSVERAAAHLSSSMDRVGSTLHLASGDVRLFANDNSFFLLAQDEEGITEDVIAWGLASHGGNLPDATRQVLMASKVTSAYCTNGAYAVTMSQGRADGVVAVWGATLAQQDAGQIPATPPEIGEKLSRDIVEIYSIKRQPPAAASAPALYPSFAARHRDGSYVLWGGAVANQVFIPVDQNFPIPGSTGRLPSEKSRSSRPSPRYSFV